MAVLDPAIHATELPRMRPAWVYMMTNRPDGILYTGVTTNLIARGWHHREGTFKGFPEEYGLKHLVYFEGHASVLGAIQREKNIKHWKRAWKARLILEANLVMDRPV